MTGTGSPGRSSPAGEAASFLERTAAHARAERSEPLAVTTDIEAPGTEFHRGVGALLAVRDRLLLVHRSLTFLGFDIRRMRKPGTSKYYVYTKPSRKAIRSVKDKAKAKTYRSTLHRDLDELILSLDRSLAG